MLDRPASHTPDAAAAAPATATSATTLTALLDELTGRGFTASFASRAGGTIWCSMCRVTSPAGDYHVVGTRRLEGASDPDAEVLMMFGNCPACDAAGTAAFGYGPEADPTDADAVAQLDLRDGSQR